MITGRITSVSLENIKCLSEVLEELIEIIVSQEMPEEGLKELTLKNFKV